MKIERVPGQPCIWNQIYFPGNIELVLVLTQGGMEPSDNPTTCTSSDINLFRYGQRKGTIHCNVRIIIIIFSLKFVYKTPEFAVRHIVSRYLAMCLILFSG